MNVSKKRELIIIAIINRGNRKTIEAKNLFRNCRIYLKTYSYSKFNNPQL